ncbi:hypothetical protein ABZ749_01150 [Micromonospora sp. NPDC047753]|uniref:hypothetical protein n=1 Tax=Micromonospora sp. NPDC047753 TaxID=3154817 RepID=UPI0033EC70E6
MADQRPGPIGYCDTHEKRLYSSRKQAKQTIRNHRDRGGMREYRCDLVDGFWHIGHLPLAAVEGRKTARQIYGRRAS